MHAVRHRVRTVAIVWLIGLAASVSAFVPDQCCAAHAAEAAAKAKPSCHEPAPPPTPGDACPLHHGGNKSHDCCSMKNSCNGPGSHLLTLFAFVGEIEKPAATTVTLDWQAAVVAATPSLLRQITVPDAPPPKA